MFSAPLAVEGASWLQPSRQLKIDNERGNCVWSRLPSPADSCAYTNYMLKEQYADEKLWLSGFLPTDTSYNFPGSTEAGGKREEGPRDL